MLGSSTMTWTRRLRRNPMKCEWPNPQASTGTFYRKMGRDFSCWEAIDDARETFIRIAEEIKAHLEKHSDPIAHSVTWTMYMIGKTRETAEPMVMFCCRDLDCRKQVRKSVEESGILDKYPGVRVGDASRPPDFDQLIQLAGEGLYSSFVRTNKDVPGFFGGSTSLGGYSYLPLNPSKDEIRLLHIQPAGNPTWMLSCRLVTVSLNDPPKYRVINCDRGDPEQIRQIRVDAQFWNVSTNIYEILKRLRCQDTESVIWLEALCVNERDIEEKRRQAALLDKISGKSSGTETLVKYSPFHPEEALLRESSEGFFGIRMFVNDYKKPGTCMRKVTGGGVLRSDEEYYFLTVDHIFNKQDQSSQMFTNCTENLDDAFEFDIEEDSDLRDEGLGFIEETSRGSLTPEFAESSSSGDTAISTTAFCSVTDQLETSLEEREGATKSDIATEVISPPRSTPIPEIPEPALELVGMPLHRSEALDFALIKILQGHGTPSNRIRLGLGSTIESLYPSRIVESLSVHSTNVLTVTGSAGLLRGSISGLPTYTNRPGYNTFKEVWTVRLNGQLSDGDCGSWVVDAENGNLFGHIVAGSPNTGSAYVVPTHHVLQSLERSEFPKLARTLRLPESPFIEEIPMSSTMETFRKAEDLPGFLESTLKRSSVLPGYETTAAAIDYTLKSKGAETDDMGLSPIIPTVDAILGAKMEDDLHLD